MTDYPQQAVVFSLGAAGPGEHPHPLPPLDLTSASRAQQAVVPAAAGPPQHLAAWGARDSSGLVDDV